MHTMNNKLLTGLLLSLAVTLNISSCAAVTPAASATYVALETSIAGNSKIPAVAVPSDVRSMKIVLKDQDISRDVKQVLTAEIPRGSYTVVSYNQKVLIAGQVPTQSDKIKATSAAQHSVGVEKVWNYLTIGSNETSGEITQDAYLTVMAKNRLLGQSGVNPNNYIVATSKGVIYFLGSNVGKKEQIEEVISGIKDIESVKNVVNLIDG